MIKGSKIARDGKSPLKKYKETFGSSKLCNDTFAPKETNMKYKLNLFFVALVAIIFSSCETVKQTWVAPPYTSVDKIVNLKQGMTMADVTKTLGIDAYDIYHIQEDGSSVLLYNYRVKDRITELPMEPKKRDEFLHGESAQTAGTPYYKMESSIAYILYKDGKMRSVITDEGKVNSEFLMLINGNLKLLSKEDLAQLNIKKIGGQYVLTTPKESTTEVIAIKELKEKEQIMAPVVRTTTDNKTKGCLAAGGVIGAVALIIGLVAAIASY
jgi:hypothetical protein